MKDQVVVTYLICIKLYERHPHTSSLQKSKYCVMSDPFLAEQFGRGLGYGRLATDRPYSRHLLGTCATF